MHARRAARRSVCEPVELDSTGKAAAKSAAPGRCTAAPALLGAAAAAALLLA